MTLMRTRLASTGGKARIDWRWALILASLTISMHLPLVSWGLPNATAPDRTKTVATDELVPLEPLAEMHSTFVQSKADRNYSYPWWHYFVVSAAQSPYLGYLWATGQMDAPSAVFPFGLSDPVSSLKVLSVIGRLVSVAMTAGIVVASYLIVSILWGSATGILAGSLTMLNYPLVYYGRTANLDAPVLFWTAAGVLVFARILTSGLTVRRSVWLGIFAALAMATKDQAVAVFLPFGGLLLLPTLNRHPGSSYQRRPLMLGLAISVLTYLTATGMLVDPGRHLTHVQRLLFERDTLSSAAFYHSPHPFSITGVFALLGDSAVALAALVTIPFLAASVIGMVVVGRSSPKLLLLLLPLPTVFAVALIACVAVDGEGVAHSSSLVLRSTAAARSL